ncbi:hypothetical protein [Sphingobacterium sp. UBA6320]|uniref:hypothetical protein n=1 Tax=Sphingobacterium sp. UBA6320 TaxID=1947510 RepID=UPI0025CBE56B|nr:hypothetical protein [Sphingobacterium sp. UBA6320]
MKNTLTYQLKDHLGSDFITQGLIERKKRVDAQIEEHARVYSLPGLTESEEKIISNSFLNLMYMQKDIASKINFLSSICLN